MHSSSVVSQTLHLVSVPLADLKNSPEPVSTHPDRAGGLSFLGAIAYTLGPILFAQGAMLAGLIASRVLYGGEDLLSFKLEAGSFVVFFVFVIFGPLLMFTPQMARARRQGLADYGLLAQRYVEDFQEKWIFGHGNSPEKVLGTGDIQSLADLGNSYSVVQEMRVVPFGLKDVSRLAAATAAPMVPLLLRILRQLWLAIVLQHANSPPRLVGLPPCRIR